MSALVEQPQYLPLLFPLFFAGIWVSVSLVISRLGWSSFAECYPAQGKPLGEAYNSPSSWFGTIFASYRNVVRVVFTEAGIYFSVMFLFRAFHPPFLVPWASVRSIERKKVFVVSRLRIDIEDSCGEIHVLLPLKAETELRAHCKRPDLLARL